MSTDTDTPATAHKDYENHAVILTGIGKAKGQTHLVVASAKEAPQAAAAAQRLVGEDFVPAIALTGKSLRELIGALDGVQVRPGQALNMTGDKVIVF